MRLPISRLNRWHWLMWWPRRCRGGASTSDSVESFTSNSVENDKQKFDFGNYFTRFFLIRPMEFRMGKIACQVNTTETRWAGFLVDRWVTEDRACSRITLSDERLSNRLGDPQGSFR